MDLEAHRFEKPTRGQLLGILVLLVLLSMFLAAEDYIESQISSNPELASGEFALGTIIFIIVVLMLYVPFFWLCWNKLAAPIYRLLTMSYAQCLLLILLFEFFVVE